MKKRAGARARRPRASRGSKARRTSTPLNRSRKRSRGSTKEPQRTRQVPALRWNPDPEDVQRSVVQLVLSLIEFIRRLMERQALRRFENKTLTPQEIENVGLALMKLEQTIQDIAKRFKLDPDDLNLDLGPIGRLH